MRDGLQSNEFNGGAYHQSSSGEMFFGGINGFNAFLPEQVRENAYVPPVALTSLTQSGEAVDVFDFNIVDGGGGDELTLDVTQIVLNTSGTGDFSKVTWRQGRSIAR